MKTLISATLAATLALGAASASAETRDERAEARFAEMTEGRVAGEADSCITVFNARRLEVVENVGIAFERGDTIWIARVKNPNQLDYHDVPIIERFGSRICTTDVMRTVDRYTGHFSGVVFLDDFVPYTRESVSENG